MDNLVQSGPIDPRLLNVARVVPHQVGLVKLSKTQLRVLNTIRGNEEVTALVISERCKVSSSWASTLLRRLYEKRYLNRSSASLQEGGVEFLYNKVTRSKLRCTF